jgi:hypothetical protein
LKNKRDKKLSLVVVLEEMNKKDTRTIILKSLFGGIISGLGYVAFLSGDDYFCGKAFDLPKYRNNLLYFSVVISVVYFFMMKRKLKKNSDK